MRGPKRADGVVSEELLDGESVVSTTNAARAVVLNAVGAAVLDLCDGNHSIDEIAAFICDHTDASDAVRVRADVVAMLSELEAAGVVELA